MSQISLMSSLVLYVVVVTVVVQLIMTLNNVRIQSKFGF